MTKDGPKRYSIEEFHEKGWAETYNLTKEDAWKMLKQHDVSDAKTTQVLNILLKEGIIDGKLIGKGKVQDRGWRISEASLRLYIDYKKLTFGEYQDLIKRLGEKVHEVEEENEEAESL